MERRKFLASGGGLALADAIPASSAAREVVRSTANDLPRKVIVGTMMHAFWGPHPGLKSRLDELAGFVDKMAEDAKQKYGRGVDLAILPEVAITGELGKDALEHAVPYEGPVQDVFSHKAREHRCYVIVSTYLLESKKKKLISNAAILVGRDGERVGTYRKVHLVISPETRWEACATPGREVPVFNCDFGKIGAQICFDLHFDYGWRELSRKSAELIAFPTQTPQTVRPALRALTHRYYVVSSTWRSNASVFEPTGRILAQIRPPESVLVQELDLSYAIIPYSSKLQHGKAFEKAFGQKVGFRYYEDEDCGIFWSNDPKVSIGEMARSLGLVEIQEKFKRADKIFAERGVLGH